MHYRTALLDVKMIMNMRFHSRQFSLLYRSQETMRNLLMQRAQHHRQSQTLSHWIAVSIHPSPLTVPVLLLHVCSHVCEEMQRGA